MKRPRATGRTAPLALAVRVGWGVSLLAVPGPLLKLMGGADEGRTPRRVMRVLGARHLMEAAAEQRFGETVRQLGVVTDVLHAVTDVIFGYRDRRWRRAALSDAVITSGFVALGVTNR